MFRQEKLIRNSIEMTQCIEFLKTKHGMNHCGVHPNVTREKGFRIELHHTPFTLFDIVGAVVNKRLQKEQSLKMQDIAEEVMQLHYLELCGLWPCCETCHHWCHSDEGGLFIPMEKTYGNPKLFAEMYYPYFSDALKTKWDNLKVLDAGYAMIEAVLPKELQKKYIYVTPSEKMAGEAISTNKLIDFIQVLNEPKDDGPKIITPDRNRDEDGFYVLHRRIS